MEEILKVAAGVTRLTVNLDNDDVELFEGVWPVPNGIALHSYLIQGQKLVLVDPWDAGGYGVEEIGADLSDLGLRWTSVSAVAFTKAPAPDFEARLKQANPALEIWGLPMAGARHDLGKGMVLEERGGFWWTQGTAFTGDVFSGLGWVEETPWTEDLGEHEARYFEDEALRWFSFRPLVPAAVPSDTKVVAPAHGCLWRNPDQALRRAQKFDSWSGDALDEVTVIWKAGDDEAVDALVGGVLDIGAGLNLYRVPGDDATTLAAGARRASLVVLAPGLDDGFLKGLHKDVWRPTGTPAELRTGVINQWDE